MTALLQALAIDGRGNMAATSLNLTAEMIEGNVDETRREVVINSVSVVPDDPQQIPVSVRNVTATQFAVAENIRLLLRPAGGRPGPTLTTMDGHIMASHNVADDLRFESYSSAQRPTIVLPSSNAVGLSIADGLVTVHGDFELVLWDTTLTIQSVEGTSTIQTGLEVEEIAPPPPGVPRGVERTTAREAFLTVTNGSLTFGTVAEVQHFAAHATVIGINDGSSVILQGATGTTRLRGVNLEFLNNVVSLSGAASASIRPGPDASLQAVLGGEPDAIIVDGTAVVLPPEPAQGSPWWALVIGAFVLGALVIWWRRRRLRRLMADLDRLMTSGNYEAAIPKAKRLRRTARFAEEAVVAQGVALVRLGREREAEAILLAAPRRRGSHPGRDFLLARISAADGRLQEAEQWLADCLVAAPSYAVDAATDPVLAPIVKAVRSKHRLEVGGYA